jgi:hypothetical protein
MNQEQPTIGYDQFMPQPLQERLRIFNQISAENRALLIKTHVERWLKLNRPRLIHEQVAVVEEIIRSISPEWYKIEERPVEQVTQEAETLRRKAEAVFSSEDVIQIMSNRANYVPEVKDKKG